MARRNDEDFTTHEQVAGWYDRKFTEMGGSWDVPEAELDEFLDLLRVPLRLHSATRESEPYCKVLELGCGDGKLLRRVMLRGQYAVGIDISPVALEMARKKCSVTDEMAGQMKALRIAPPKLFLQQDPMEKIEAADGVFDRAISYGSMEHALSIYHAVAETFRVLKSGGLFLNYAPNEKWVHMDQPLETVMTADEWIAELTGAGFEMDRLIERGDNTIYIARKP